MKPDEYVRHDATDLAALVRKGEVTPGELLDAALERIAARNPALNAIATLAEERARRSVEAGPAGSAGRGAGPGPFHGVPFLLKDLAVSARGLRCTAGSRFFADMVPDHDSTLVERYEAAGLVILGTTTSPEFGMTSTTQSALFGTTANPWNTAFSPGGSSGGAAAAVASGMVPMAHASDGGGSIRVPAATCGLVGLKPTRARVPSGPDAGEGWAGAAISHVVSRSLRDSAALLDAVTGRAPGDPYDAPPRPGTFLAEVGAPPGRLRIALCTEAFNGAPVDPQAKAAAEDAARLLAELGHDVEPGAPEFDRKAFAASMTTVIQAHVATMIAAREAAIGRACTEDDLEPMNWKVLVRGRALPATGYLAALDILHRTSRQVAALFQGVDILLTPAMPAADLPLGFARLDDPSARSFGAELSRCIGFTSLFNATGQPAMTLPISRTANGVPLGVQLVAGFGADGLLFRLAAQLAVARPWTGLAAA